MANIIITGASRGIGFELVRQYAAAGDRVYAMCRDPERGDALRNLAQESKGRVSVHKMDVGDDASVRAAFEAIEDIDILFNVAGVLGSVEPELEVGASDWAAWQDVFNIMTLGPLRVLQAALPMMRAGSKVINITSQLAASTWPYGGLYPYVATKAALNRMMRSVAIDLKPRDIVVGLLHPGYVRTDMSGPDADISPEESAEGIRKVSANWSMDRSGEFLKWDGEPHPW
ncbi:NAD(P)-dependent dehydrogenase, short-chain alcohol dehydrogenase family [Sphingobium faniae]|nr:NAD(P)-dependent dehydrogenase, short-chain alcohol dehydrogenase family [Sphingobium faniae]